MSPATSLPVRPRRSMLFMLLATTAAATLLGGCNQTGKLFSRSGGGESVQMSAAEAAGATQRWAAAYAKDPRDPKNALGYAQALKAIGSRDRSLEVLKTAYQINPNSGEIAAELGRAALEVGRLDIAKQTLKVAEAQGVSDWRTLSAQGTIRAKQGEHAEAQQYYLAALKQKPDAVSVINNLALSYALDGKAKESEKLLREAVASGHEDKRLRQNLALVLGLQGKFGEAREVASVDMTEQQAKSSMAYLQNMLSKPRSVASADTVEGDAGGDDWQPYASASAKKEAPVQSAAASPSPAKLQVVVASQEVTAPKASKGKPVQAAASSPSINPVRAAAASAAAKPSQTAVVPAGLGEPAEAKPVLWKSSIAPSAQAATATVRAPTPITPKAGTVSTGGTTNKAKSD